jgi:Ca2+-binding EF-hand superfamily protein
LRAVYNTELVQTLFIALLSLLCDVGVLWFHWTRPPHPKFLMRTPRIISIKLHVLSGTVEILCGAAAWFVPDSSWLVAGQCLASCFHVATAIYQTPIVFGMQAFMIPAYMYCVGTKIYCTLDLVANYTCYYKVLRLFVVHSIYAWCRFFFVMFQAFHVLEDCRYTVAIMFAGMVCLPAVGPAVNLGACIFICAYMFLLSAFGSKAEVAMQMHENSRDMFSNEGFRGALSASSTCPFAEIKPDEYNGMVEELFRNLDSNGNGRLEVAEVKGMADKYRSPELLQGLELFLELHPKQASLTLDEFRASFLSKNTAAQAFRANVDKEHDEAVEEAGRGGADVPAAGDELLLKLANHRGGSHKWVLVQGLLYIAVAGIATSMHTPLYEVLCGTYSSNPGCELSASQRDVWRGVGVCGVYVGVLYVLSSSLVLSSVVLRLVFGGPPARYARVRLEPTETFAAHSVLARCVVLPALLAAWCLVLFETNAARFLGAVMGVADFLLGAATLVLLRRTRGAGTASLQGPPVAGEELWEGVGGNLVAHLTHFKAVHQWVLTQGCLYMVGGFAIGFCFPVVEAILGERFDGGAADFYRGMGLVVAHIGCMYVLMSTFKREGQLWLVTGGRAGCGVKMSPTEAFSVMSALSRALFFPAATAVCVLAKVLETEPAVHLMGGFAALEVSLAALTWLQHRLCQCGDGAFAIAKAAEALDQSLEGFQLKQARVIFDAIDTDGTGQLKVWEMGQLLSQYGMPLTDVRIVMEKFSSQGTIDLQTFRTHFKHLWQFQRQEMQTSFRELRVHRERSEALSAAYAEQDSRLGEPSSCFGCRRRVVGSAVTPVRSPSQRNSLIEVVPFQDVQEEGVAASEESAAKNRASGDGAPAGRAAAALTPPAAGSDEQHQG